MTITPDPAFQGRERITYGSFDDFKNRYLNRRIPVSGDKELPLGRWWLEHNKRRQYESVEFLPGREREGVYNLWKGFACEAVAGDCSLFLDHVLNNVCCGHEALNEYLLNWMARAVQRPDEPGQVAVVLRGGRGTGKSFFAQTFGSLFGPHFLQVSDARHLVGNFNAHLRDTVVLFADEAFFAGDKKHESILKMLITEPTLMIESKYQDAEMARNYTHLIMASNDEWVIPAGEDERRFFVLDVGSDRAQDTSYFKVIAKQMECGGRSALLNLLMNRDLSSFEVRKVPATRALREQKQLSQEPYEAVMLDMLQSGVTPDPDFLKDEPNWVSVEGIVQAMADRSELPRNRRSLHTHIGLYLRKSVELDGRSDVISTRVKRRCIISGSRPFEAPEEYVGPTQEVRRTMFRLRPLHDLRAEHSRLVEAWPLHPAKWVFEPDPPPEEIMRQYELAMLGREH
jgi:hypothetical protein